MTRSKADSPFNDPADRRHLDDCLRDGAAALDLSGVVRGRMLDYLALLQRWNRAYNLTAVRDPEQMVIRLLLDSLSIAPYIRGPRVLDVGSGPGLPGIPLALVQPETAFVLLDSSGKKTRFQRQAIAELGLANVSAEQARAEDYRPEAPFDTVVSRAFSALSEFVSVSAPLCRPEGQLLAMKGRYPAGELAQIPEGWQVTAVEQLQVAGLDAQRYLVRIGRMRT